MSANSEGAISKALSSNPPPMPSTSPNPLPCIDPQSVLERGIPLVADPPNSSSRSLYPYVCVYMFDDREAVKDTVARSKS